MLGKRGRHIMTLALALVAPLAAAPARAEAQGRTMPRKPAGSSPRLHSKDMSPGTFNVLYRPSVVLRKGNGRGSGTILASVPGDTLILTAAHVLRTPGALEVEFQPYNLGVPNDPRSAQKWPRVVAAEVVASDTAADVALARVRGMVALPHSARLAGPDENPKPGDVLTALGYDGATALIGWRTRVEALARVDLGFGGGARPYLVTSRPSIEGRSGGALFRTDGTVAGVCTGRFELEPGRWVGLFASLESIHRLLREAGQDARVTRARPPSGQ